jgi:zinc protease
MSRRKCLGGLNSSRLDRILVRDEQSAVSVSSSVLPFQRISMFFVTVDVKPGVDPATVSARLDQIIGEYLADRPN